jgi:threonine synthase
LADSICVDVPRNGFHALKLLQDNNGRMIRVSDQEILEAQHKLASSAGLFSEPAGATAFAGFLKEQNNISKDSLVSVISTGNGLKDVNSAMKGVKQPENSISSIEEAL